MDSEETFYKLTCLETQKETSSSRNFSGRGRALYPNGDIYEGEFLSGKRTGRGTYTYQKGDSYSGQWLNNFKDGFGEMKYKNKSVFRGNFQNSRRHGEGKLKYPNGDFYSGQWKYGIRHGKGIYSYQENQQRLEGVWCKGNIVQGRWVLPGGVVYKGNFDNNVPVGEGEWQLANGESVQGTFLQK